MAADQRVSEGPVQQEVPRQVQDPVGHLVDPLGCFLHGEHGQTDVLKPHTDFISFILLLTFTETKPEAAPIRSALRKQILLLSCFL